MRVTHLLARGGVLLSLVAGAATAAPDNGNGKLALEVLLFPQSVRADSERTLTLCLYNRGGANRLEAGDDDHLLVRLPVGAAPGDLVDDPLGLACTNAPEDWACTVDVAEPDAVVVRVGPSGDVVDVAERDTLCFDLTGVRIAATEGVAVVTATQAVARRRADPLERERLFLFKSLAGVIYHEDLAGVTEAQHHERYVDAEAWAAVLARDGAGSGLDADALDGLDSTDVVRVGDPAGGDLAGDYPDPSVADGAVTETHLAFDTATQAELDEVALDAVTGVAAGDGLTGGGTTGDVSLALTAEYLDGSAHDDRFLTGLTAGDGLTGGADSGDATMSLGTEYLDGSAHDGRFLSLVTTDAQVVRGPLTLQDAPLTLDGQPLTVNLAGGRVGLGTGSTQLCGTQAELVLSPTADCSAAPRAHLVGIGDGSLSLGRAHGTTTTLSARPLESPQGAQRQWRTLRGGHLVLGNGVVAQTVSIRGGGEVRDTSTFPPEDSVEGGRIHLGNGSGVDTVRLRADDAHFALWSEDGARDLVRLATGDGVGTLSLENATGATTVQLLGGTGTGGRGKIVTDVLDASGRVLVTGDAGGGQGGVSLRDADGDVRVVLDGDGSLRLQDAAGEDRIVLDADHGGLGRSRVITDALQITGGADLSEHFEVAGGAVPGTVVSVDPTTEGGLVVSRRAYDPLVAGIVSGAGGVRPGMVMGQRGSVADGSHPVALTGRVYCLADESGGAIRPGDLLTSSSRPGHCMRVGDHDRALGAVLGKAMGRVENGLVLVLVGLQ